MKRSVGQLGSIKSRGYGFVEMRMFCWMCGHTRFNRIINKMIRNKVEVTFIKDKMRETYMVWSYYKEYGCTSEEI